MYFAANECIWSLWTHRAATIHQNGVVGKRRSPLEVIRDEGPHQLAFLSAAGMSGPHLTDDGIVYRGDGIEISMSYHGRPDAGLHTFVCRLAPDGTWRWADLACLHVACGHGVLQDVPGNAPNQAVASKRVTQHAAVLRRIAAPAESRSGVVRRGLDDEAARTLAVIDGRSMAELKFGPTSESGPRSSGVRRGTCRRQSAGCAR